MAIARLHNHSDYLQFLDENGYTHLGWHNAGIKVPDANDWRCIYKNWSGSYTIMVSDTLKNFYCVDMGD